VGRLAEREWAAFLAESEVTQAEFTVLAVLNDLGPLRQRDVARHAVVDPRNVVATVAQLTARGLVTETSHATDRRSKMLSLTSAGRRELEDLASRIGEQRRQFFAALSDDEYQTLSRLLAKVYDAHTCEDPLE
jgi:DNA-binding MarR family transcriptional regulator